MVRWLREKLQRQSAWSGSHGHQRSRAESQDLVPARRRRGRHDGGQANSQFSSDARRHSGSQYADEDVAMAVGAKWEGRGVCWR